MSAQIPNLPAAAAIATTTLFETVDPAGTNASQKAAFQLFLDFLAANNIVFGGNASISAAGDINGASLSADNGVTDSFQVLTALPTTFSTFNFAGGILTSVTTP